MGRSVYVPRTGSVSDWQPVVKMFESAGWNVTDEPGCYKDLDLVDLVCFTGGSDVSPSLYGEENTSSYCDYDRDVKEREIYQYCVGQMPMVGICRGGQFLNVMNGGKMIQHISGHSGSQTIWIKPSDGSPTIPYTIREDHHQGIIPAEDATLIGLDTRDGNHEIVWYSETKSLCFQPHPEWGHDGTKELFFNLIEEYIYE